MSGSPFAASKRERKVAQTCKAKRDRKVKGRAPLLACMFLRNSTRASQIWGALFGPRGCHVCVTFRARFGAAAKDPKKGAGGARFQGVLASFLVVVLVERKAHRGTPLQWASEETATGASLGRPPACNLLGGPWRGCHPNGAAAYRAEAGGDGVRVAAGRAGSPVCCRSASDAVRCLCPSWRFGASM